VFILVLRRLSRVRKPIPLLTQTFVDVPTIVY
jgi:hypothetical protein